MGGWGDFKSFKRPDLCMIFYGFKFTEEKWRTGKNGIKEAISKLSSKKPELAIVFLKDSGGIATKSKKCDENVKNY